jgi:hypothetical protein
MTLSEQETMLYEKLLMVLDRRETLGRLREDDFSEQQVFQFLNSQNPDLAIVGTDLLSLLPEEPDVELFAHSSNAARNYVRYRMAQLMAESGEFHLPERFLEQREFRPHYDELASRLSGRDGGGALTATPTQDLTVIVHGTWAATSTWWRPDGNFWKYLDSLTGNVYAGPNPFLWSGNNHHTDRVRGARALITWISDQNYRYLDLIAHNHGGNVCLHASRLGLRIRKLILLGTPIRLEYLPDLSNIGELHNIYSTGDLVQKPATFPNRRSEGRSLSDAERITNHHADDNGSGQKPGHSELHEPATWSANGLDRLL